MRFQVHDTTVMSSIRAAFAAILRVFGVETEGPTRAANPQAAYAAMVQVLNIEAIAQDIIDHWIRTTFPQPVDLRDAEQRRRLCNIQIAAQLTLELGDMADRRRWAILQVIDHLAPINLEYRCFMTPEYLRPQVKNLIVVHPLSALAPMITWFPAYTHLSHYDMSRRSVQLTTQRFANLGRVTHDFAFRDITLLDHLKSPGVSMSALLSELSLWIGDIQSSRRGSLELSVVLSDKTMKRDDEAAVIDVVGQSNNQVAWRLVGNVGAVFRIA
ncbi:hypothetical protein LTR56_019288 [Elasticomyces elasticus]|nr:hypothetical protein LTR56_019288 [Elasticomyces elasticus]KAK3635301.1 hypothetical protein LTR22_019229 [Elasticomyces elasticus]KAK5749464.1 hypothetical protein LTS12_020457 [Elasticomyces elasticus]